MNLYNGVLLPILFGLTLFPLQSFDGMLRSIPRDKSVENNDFIKIYQQKKCGLELEAAIDQLIRLRLPSCGPGFDSQ